MSRLKKVIYSLCEILINYHKTQTAKTYSSEELLKPSYPQDRFIETLEILVEESTKIYKTRASLLNYFKYLLIELKPLVEKKEALSKDESLLIQGYLFDLIMNLSKLLQTPQTSSLLLNYSGRSELAAGFIRGFSWGTLCHSGQLVKKMLIGPLQLPSELAPDKLGDFIQTLIDEHQGRLVPLLKTEIEELGKEKLVLAEENQYLKDKIASYEKEKCDLSVELDALRLEIKTIKLSQMKQSVVSSPFPKGVLHRGYPGLFSPFDFNPIMESSVRKKEVIEPQHTPSFSMKDRVE